MRAVGLDLPQASMVFATRTAVVAMLTGTLVTLVASVWPAVRATRISPIAAVREGGMVVKKPSRKTLVVGLVLTALSAAALVNGTLGNDVSTLVRVLGIALGVLGLFVGIALIAPRLIRPLARFVGLPGARLGGAGRTARPGERDPEPGPHRLDRRGADDRADARLVRRRLRQGAPRERREEPAEAARHEPRDHLAERLGHGPGRRRRGCGGSAEGVALASSIRGDRAQLDGGGEVDVSGVDPATIGRAYNFEWVEGSAAALALARGRRRDRARRPRAAGERQGRGRGPLRFLTPAGKQVEHGRPRRLREARRPRPAARPGRALAGGLRPLVPAARRPAHARQADSTAALEQALAAYPDAKLQTGDEFIASWTQWLTDVMSLFYVLLALSVIVSLFGMVNTLVLAVFERTRELGMLRAVGMTRRQMRRMIRHEAVVTSLIGAALGLPLGVALGALVTQSLSRVRRLVLAAGRSARRVRGRRDRGRDRRGGAAGAPGGAAERARGAPVRVAASEETAERARRGPPAPQ